MRRLIKQTLCAIILTLCYPSYLATTSSNVSNVAPTIWHSGCNSREWFPKNLEPSYQNNCVKKYAEGYVFSDNTKSAIFTCEATYPILWKFPLSESYKIEYGRDSTFNVTQKQPVVKIYRSIIIVSFGNSAPVSGTVSCVSLEIKPKVKTTINFVKELPQNHDPSKILEIQLEVEIDQGRFNPLIIPCISSHPNQTVSLSMKMGPKDKPIWQLVNLKQHGIKANPNFGVIFTKPTTTREIPADYVGLFNCSIGNTTQKTLFNVTLGNTQGRIAFPSKSVTSGKAKVGVNPVYYSPIYTRIQLECCSGSADTSPDLLELGFYSEDEYEFKKKEALETFENMVHNKTKKPSRGKDCKTELLITPMEIVTCKGGNVDFQETYVHVFHKFTNAPVEERYKKILESDNLANSSATHFALITRYVPMSNALGLGVNQTIFLTVTKRLQKFTGKRPMDDYYTLLGFSSKYEELFYDNQTEPTRQTISWENDNRDLTDLHEYERSTYYEGEPLTVMCLGLRPFYTNGAKLAVGYKNGSISELPVESFVDRQGFQNVFLHKTNVVFSSQRVRTISLISKVVNATLDMESLECWMPQIKSSKWAKLVKKVNVVKAAKNVEAASGKSK